MQLAAAESSACDSELFFHWAKDALRHCQRTFVSVSRTVRRSVTPCCVGRWQHRAARLLQAHAGPHSCSQNAGSTFQLALQLASAAKRWELPVASAGAALEYQ